MIFNRFSILSSLLAATVGAVPFVAEDFPLSVIPLDELPAPDTIPAPVNVTEPIKLATRATEGIRFVNCQGNGYSYSIEIVGPPLYSQFASEITPELGSLTSQSQELINLHRRVVLQ